MDEPKILTYEAENIIMFQGEKEYVMYQIVEGSVALFINYDTKDQILLDTLGVGKLFGELAVLEHQPHNATAVALERTTVKAYPAEQVEEMIRQNPTFALEVMHNLDAFANAAVGKLEQLHGALLPDTRQHPESMEVVDRFLREHTAYDKDGKPYFLMKV